MLPCYAGLAGPQCYALTTFGWQPFTIAQTHLVDWCVILSKPEIQHRAMCSLEALDVSIPFSLSKSWSQTWHCLNHKHNTVSITNITLSWSQTWHCLNHKHNTVLITNVTLSQSQMWHCLQMIYTWNWGFWDENIPIRGKIILFGDENIPIGEKSILFGDACLGEI